MVRDWKTTVTATVGFIATMLQQFGLIELTPDQQNALIMVILLIVGILAADSKKEAK